MKLTEHQKRLWQAMIDIIQDYLDKKSTNFSYLVGQLEGMLDASDIDDKIIIEKWYNFWTSLEIRRATGANDINYKNTLDDLRKMQSFLLKFRDLPKIEELANEDPTT